MLDTLVCIIVLKKKKDQFNQAELSSVQPEPIYTDKHVHIYTQISPRILRLVKGGLSEGEQFLMKTQIPSKK